jgi:hypothetical protein
MAASGFVRDAGRTGEGVMIARTVRTREAANPFWQWPLRLTDYDRSDCLSSTEQHVLTHDLAHALIVERATRAVLDRLHGIERLCRPLDDALAAVDHPGQHDHRVKLMVLKQRALLGTAYWAWNAAPWCEILGTTPQAFFAAHAPKPHDGGERRVLIAVAYLLRCFTDIPALGEVKRVALAEKIFGQARITSALQRV